MNTNCCGVNRESLTGSSRPRIAKTMDLDARTCPAFKRRRVAESDRLSSHHEEHEAHGAWRSAEISADFVIRKAGSEEKGFPR